HAFPHAQTTAAIAMPALPTPIARRTVYARDLARAYSERQRLRTVRPAVTGIVSLRPDCGLLRLLLPCSRALGTLNLPVMGQHYARKLRPITGPERPHD